MESLFCVVGSILIKLFDSNKIFLSLKNIYIEREKDNN